MSLVLLLPLSNVERGTGGEVRVPGERRGGEIIYNLHIVEKFI